MFISVWQELLITRLAKQSRYRVIPDPARVHSLAYQLEVALKEGSPLYRLPLGELRTGVTVWQKSGLKIPRSPPAVRIGNWVNLSFLACSGSDMAWEQTPYGRMHLCPLHTVFWRLEKCSSISSSPPHCQLTVSFASDPSISAQMTSSML